MKKKIAAAKETLSVSLIRESDALSAKSAAEGDL